MNFSKFVSLIAFCCVQLIVTSLAANPTNTTSCPMGNMDIFLIADPSSYPLLAFLLNSIARFMPCSRRINLLVDSGESYRRVKLWLPPQYGSHHVIRVFPFVFPEDVPVISHFADQHKAGYILQAWAMLWADRFSEDSSSSKFYHYSMDNSLRNSIESQEVDYIMFMDTDSLFGMPVTCSTLFDHKGKPFFPAWSIGEQSQFGPSCLDMVGSKCDRSYMAFFPFVYPIRAFPLLRHHIWHRIDAAAPSFNAVFNGWAKHATWKFFSQFVVMGEYLRSQHNEQTRQIMCEPGPGNLAFVHSNEHSHSSPAGTSQYFAASLSGTWADPLSDSQMCHQYVPPGVHYGWPYQFYLHNAAKAEYDWGYFRGPGVPKSVHPVDRQFTSKFSSKTLTKLAEFVHHGQCLSDHWHRSTASDQNACSSNGPTAVHPMVDLYSSRELNMEVVRATFTHPSSAIVEDSVKQHHSHPRQQRHLRQKDDSRHSILASATASLVSKVPFIGSHPPPKATSSYSGPQIHHVGTHIHPPVPGATHSDPSPPPPPAPTASNSPPHTEQLRQTHASAPPPKPTHTTHAPPAAKHSPPPPQARQHNPGNSPGAFTVHLPPLGVVEPDEPAFQGFCSRLNQQLPRL